jgi:hypothetical protein
MKIHLDVIFQIMDVIETMGFSEMGEKFLESHILEAVGVAQQYRGKKVVIFQSDWKWGDKEIRGHRMRETVADSMIAPSEEMRRKFVLTASDADGEEMFFMFGQVINEFPFGEIAERMVLAAEGRDEVKAGILTIRRDCQGVVTIYLRKDDFDNSRWDDHEMYKGFIRYPMVRQTVLDMMGPTQRFYGDFSRLGYDMFSKHVRSCISVYMEGGSCVIWVDQESGIVDTLTWGEGVRKERKGAPDAFQSGELYTTFKIYGMVKFALHPAIQEGYTPGHSDSMLRNLGVRNGILYNGAGIPARCLIYEASIVSSHEKKKSNPFLDQKELLLPVEELRRYKKRLIGKFGNTRTMRNRVSLLDNQAVSACPPMKWIVGEMNKKVRRIYFLHRSVYRSL